MKHSPWGSVQDHKVIADGIVLVSTASHGGFMLSPARTAEFKAALPAFRPFAGDGALEEDCDVALAYIVWPDLFKPEDVGRAVSMILAYGDQSNAPDNYFAAARDLAASRAVAGVQS